MFCPDIDDTNDTVLAFLPRGRAWQTHDAAISKSTSVLKALAYALATNVQYIENVLCNAFEEFFCATADGEQLLWMEDYGLPDECDPFGTDVCTKVLATGGTSIQYYIDLAANMGWVIAARWLKGDDVTFPGVVSTLHITIDSGASSASNFEVLALDNWSVGEDDHFGDPDFTSLACSFDSILPAHADMTVEVI